MLQAVIVMAFVALMGIGVVIYDHYSSRKHKHP